MLNSIKRSSVAYLWFAGFLLIVASFISEAGTFEDNHNQFLEEIVAEVSDVGEEFESDSDDLPITVLFSTFELPQQERLTHGFISTPNKVNSVQQTSICPRGPPHFI